MLDAYDASDLSDELYSSAEATGDRDQAGPAVKFTVPTIADGHVFVGTENELDVYGLLATTVDAELRALARRSTRRTASTS